MIRLRHKVLIQGFRLFDQVTLLACFAAIVELGKRARGRGAIEAVAEQAYSLNAVIGIVLLCIGWIVIFAHFVRYNANRFNTLRSQLIDLVKATTAASFWLLVISATFAFSRISTFDIFLFCCVTTLIGVLTRIFLRRLLTVARKSGYNYRHLLVIGTNPRALSMAARIESSPELGYRMVGFLTENGQTGEIAAPRKTSGNWRVLGPTSALQNVLEHETVDEILICVHAEQHFATILQAIRHARELGVVVRLLPDAEDARLLTKLHIESFEGEYVVTMFREQHLAQLLAKWTIDIVISAALLILLSPFLLLIAILVKLTSPGPVLFTQDRVGMNKRRFRLYKFRSMYVDAEQRKPELAAQNEMDGPVFKIKDDPRITPLGRFLRRTSIDELPQLLNILRGQMSLVGPRPPLPEEVDRYEWLYRRRLSIKPGITCLWQISGRNQISFQQWMELDRAYIENWSLWLDFKILFKTIPVVLWGKGAS